MVEKNMSGLCSNIFFKAPDWPMTLLLWTAFSPALSVADLNLMFPSIFSFGLLRILAFVMILTKASFYLSFLNGFFVIVVFSVFNIVVVITYQKKHCCCY